MTSQHPKSSLTATDIAVLSPSQRELLSQLQVAGDQEDFGGTFHASVEEWESASTGQLLGLAFLLGNEPVGVVLLKRPPLSPDWVPDDAVSLHGLKIASDYQGRGLGRIAFGLALDAARAHWPTANQLVLAVDAGNEPALAVYRRYGMRDSGPIFQGRIGYEHRLELKLDKGPTVDNGAARL